MTPPGSATCEHVRNYRQVTPPGSGADEARRVLSIGDPSGVHGKQSDGNYREVTPPGPLPLVGFPEARWVGCLGRAAGGGLPGSASTAEDRTHCPNDARNMILEGAWKLRVLFYL